MAIDATTAALVGGAVGAGIAGIFSLLSQWMTRRAEYKRFLLELCFKAASENLSRDTESAKISAAKAGRPVPVGPIDFYLIHMVSLMKLISNTNMSQDEILKGWEKIRSRTRAVHDSQVTQAEQERGE